MPTNRRGAEQPPPGSSSAQGGGHGASASAFPRRGLDAVVALAIAWRGVRAMVGDRYGPLSMVNAWGDWIEAVGLAAGAAALRGRRRPEAALGLAALSAFRVLGALCWHPARRVREGGHLRVWTGNLLYRSRGADRLLASIATANPDLIMLQELTPPVARRLVGRLEDAYPHRYLDPDDGPDGFGILSVARLQAGAVDALPAGNRFLQTARLHVAGHRIDLYNCHLVSPVDRDALGCLSSTGVTRLREAQADVVAAYVAAGRRPAIVAGDLNASPGQQPWRSLAAVASDVWPAAGQGVGATWPRRLPGLPRPTPPLLRLDHCFVTRPLVAASARVVRDALGSDHCPQVVDLRLEDPPA